MSYKMKRETFFSSHKIQFIANINVNFISLLFQIFFYTLACLHLPPPPSLYFTGIIWLCCFSSHHQLWKRNMKNSTLFSRLFSFWWIDCKMIRQLLEFLELDLIKAINSTTNSDDYNQHLVNADQPTLQVNQKEEGNE